MEKMEKPMSNSPFSPLAPPPRCLIIWLPVKVMNLAARYRAITYREYVDIAPTGVSTQPP